MRNINRHEINKDRDSGTTKEIHEVQLEEVVARLYASKNLQHIYK